MENSRWRSQQWSSTLDASTLYDTCWATAMKNWKNSVAGTIIPEKGNSYTQKNLNKWRHFVHQSVIWWEGITGFINCRVNAFYIVYFRPYSGVQLYLVFHVSPHQLTSTHGYIYQVFISPCYDVSCLLCTCIMSKRKTNVSHIHTQI